MLLVWLSIMRTWGILSCKHVTELLFPCQAEAPVLWLFLLILSVSITPWKMLLPWPASFLQDTWSQRVVNASPRSAWASDCHTNAHIHACSHATHKHTGVHTCIHIHTHTSICMHGAHTHTCAQTGTHRPFFPPGIPVCADVSPSQFYLLCRNKEELEWSPQ